MKKFQYFSLLLVSALISSGVAKSQIVSGNLFLQGRFLEIGAQDNASLGTSTSAPSGYHPHGGFSLCGSGSGSLASVYDWGRDGWTTGTPPYMGDYTLPGSPWEGWGVEVGGTAAFAYSTSCGYTGSMSGSHTGYISSGGSARGYWSGLTSSSRLQLKKEHRVDTNSSALIVSVDFKNVSSSTLTDIYYMRSCDPDNNQSWSGGSFTTINTVNYQNDFRHRVMVTATATGSSSSTGTPPAPYSLGTKDCRCKALIFTSWPMSTSTSLASVWAGSSSTIGTSYYTPGNNTTGDIAIGIVCKIGTLAPGDSTTMTYAYIYNGATGVDSAFPEPRLQVNGVLYDSFATVTPCSGTTITDTLPVSMVDGDDKIWKHSFWTWSPATGLTSTTGTSTSVIVSALSSTTTYTITGMDTSTGNCAMRTYILTVVPTTYGPPGVRDYYYCQGDYTSPLSATGVSLLWYTTATGGVGSTTPPTPSSATPGVYTYYVSQAPCGAGTESARSVIHVYVTPKPVVRASNNGPLCGGSTLILYATDTATAGTISYSWSGPGGFTSTLRNPTIPGASAADSGVYTVVLSVSGCVSDPSSSLAVVHYAPPAPSVVDVTYCQYDTAVRPLIAYGTSLLWFTSATGGTASASAPTPSTSTPGTFYYYVSQTVNGCQGPRAPLTVVIKPQPAPPSVLIQTYCQYDLPSPLSATGTSLLWYGSGITGSTTPPTPSTSTPGLFTYYVTQTVAGCVSPLAIDTVRVIAKPNPPIPFDTSYCQYSRPVSLIAVGANLLWYTTAAGGTHIDSTPKAPTNIPGSTTWYVSQTIQGCESDRVPVTVTILPTPDFSIRPSSKFVCQFDSIRLSYSGGSLVDAGYRWSLPTGAYFASGYSAADSSVIVYFDSLRLQNVVLTATNYHGRCSNTDTFSVKVVYQPYADFYVNNNICLDDTVTLALRSRSDNADHYIWSFDSASVITASSNTGGPYRISWRTLGLKLVTLQAVTLEGCKGIVSRDTVHIKPLPDARIDLSKVLSRLCLEDSVWLSTLNESANYSYKWKPEHFFHNNNRSGIWGRIERAGYVSVEVTDPYGCSATDSVLFRPDPCCTVSFPTAFTPNNDGRNDRFRPVFKGFHRFHAFRIVNRWGQTVYECINTDGEWDGTLNGVPQDMGVYYYFISYDCSEEGGSGGTKERIEKGEVTLIR